MWIKTEDGELVNLESICTIKVDGDEVVAEGIREFKLCKLRNYQEGNAIINSIFEGINLGRVSMNIDDIKTELVKASNQEFLGKESGDVQ